MAAASDEKEITFEAFKEKLQNHFPHLKVKDLSDQVLTKKYLKLIHFGDENNKDTIFIIDLKSPGLSDSFREVFYLQKSGVLLQYSNHPPSPFHEYIYYRSRIEKYIQQDEEQRYCSICFEDFGKNGYYVCSNCAIPWCDKCYRKLIKNWTIKCPNCQYIQKEKES